jgi:hypothetical protein
VQTSDTLLGFAQLFAGRSDAYGTGRGQVIRRPLTFVQYQLHLQGQGAGLGVFPMLEGDEVWFAAIDLDEPDFRFAAELGRFLPGAAWIEKSRSGNAHIWVFFAEPCPAWAAKGYLKAALEAFGRRDVEVFPKQDRLKPDMLGNYINLPCFGDERPILTGFTGTSDLTTTPFDDWLELPVEHWVPAALEQRTNVDDWCKRARQLGALPPEDREDTAEFGDREHMHECALWIYERRHENPLLAGGRTVVLFNVAKQLLNWRHMESPRALEMLHEINEAGERPHPRGEVERIFESVLKGRYTSSGCDEPLMADYVRPDCPIANG